jgi:hypothetical protein
MLLYLVSFLFDSNCVIFCIFNAKVVLASYISIPIEYRTAWSRGEDPSPRIIHSSPPPSGSGRKRGKGKGKGKGKCQPSEALSSASEDDVQAADSEEKGSSHGSDSDEEFEGLHEAIRQSQLESTGRTTRCTF